MAMGNALMAFPELAYADSALDAANDADVVLVATPWPEFGEINPAAARSAVTSMTVVDACQGIDVATWKEAGWRVLSLTGNHSGHRGDGPSVLAALRMETRKSRG
jgi:UDPglucose 6-dehydrogenase